MITAVVLIAYGCSVAVYLLWATGNAAKLWARFKGWTGVRLDDAGLSYPVPHGFFIVDEPTSEKLRAKTHDIDVSIKLEQRNDQTLN